jgi:electron transfer flavoprotein beta subunit
MMKALVAVKRVIDYNVKIRVNAEQTGVVEDNVKFSINPFDEIAVEEALRLREAGIIDEIVVVSAGTEKSRETLRYALALGADRGILLQQDEGEPALQALAVAKLLHHIAQKEQADLILLGKQAIDDDSNQVGQMLAALLGWPQGTFASKLEFSEGAAVQLTREIDGGLETLKLQLPAVITTDLRLNEPRYAKLPNIMKAKKKPLDVIAVGETGVDVAPRLKRLKVTPPPARAAGIMVNSVDELVEKLRNEARVIA